MALVSCPECRKEVSTHALACPQCAFPFPGKQASQVGTKLHGCPDCGCPVSRQAKICPHCGVTLTGEQTLQTIPDHSVEETWLCTHCGTPYTRKVRKEEVLVTENQTVPIISGGNKLEKPLVEGDNQEAVRFGSAKSSLESSLDPLHSQSDESNIPASLRQRSPLWQDSSLPQEMDRYVAPSRYSPGRRKSFIVGLLIFVLVTLSIGFGLLWQVQGINPLEALVTW